MLTLKLQNEPSILGFVLHLGYWYDRFQSKAMEDWVSATGR
ncbi:hypothetical protein SJA_C1-03450 [Sphingobium indicum UT26S]|uniref:Uncharacterized protein n=1 Tax=Sphingobium indicum (strain DSM 16413 / CCM 7287 / MTCC 6362 / UT26 / NBRC 101211 / UT26S) TaxID=452662 RepID=D4YXU7_SPHIU|nr:hypothetical protein SJA_C1-03450 [Sphingobium indicum UT26S]